MPMTMAMEIYIDIDMDMDTDMDTDMDKETEIDMDIDKDSDAGRRQGSRCWTSETIRMPDADKKKYGILVYCCFYHASSSIMTSVTPLVMDYFVGVRECFKLRLFSLIYRDRSWNTEYFVIHHSKTPILHLKGLLRPGHKD